MSQGRIGVAVAYKWSFPLSFFPSVFLFFSFHFLPHLALLLIFNSINFLFSFFSSTLLSSLQLGVYMASEACYNPRIAPRVWKRFQEETQQEQKTFIDTHPSHKER